MTESPVRSFSAATPITLLSNKVRNFHSERLAIDPSAQINWVPNEAVFCPLTGFA